jgi:hypothetical protein
MTTPRARLEASKTRLRGMVGVEAAQLPVIAEVNVDCAVEIAETLVGLTGAVNNMATQLQTVMNNLIKAVDRAAAQSLIASEESTKAAAESSNVAKKLNKLTIWIIVAAILSALAAGVQSTVAVYTALRPSC